MSIIDPKPAKSSKLLLDCSTSGVILDPAVASDRRAYFLAPKLEVFHTLCGSYDCQNAIQVSIGDFLALLEKFAEQDPNGDYVYNAMRVYFGVYPKGGGGHVPNGKNGFPTLLFVPTTGDDSSTPTDGEDQFDLLHFIDENGHIQADASAQVAAGWIKNFQTLWVDTLNKDGAKITGKPGFADTKALLYAMDSIGGDGEQCGLIQVITNGQADPVNPITGLEINFACFTDHETETRFKLPYQLTLIFDLVQKDDHKIASFGSNSYVPGLVDTDTGLPCPPNGNCKPPTLR